MFYKPILHSSLYYNVFILFFNSNKNTRHSFKPTENRKFNKPTKDKYILKLNVKQKSS
jgi:hypothetical protein